MALASAASRAEVAFPGDSWLRYDDPAKYGWSLDRLAAARQFSEKVKVASYMIVENGYVVDSWGDITRRYKCHSVRKSFLGALVGIHAAKGEIDPESTVGELGLDDIESLTAMEKSATVADLLKARSGIYHPAAYETAKMARSRPERGSHEPGTHYYYNNWDFNALAAVLVQQTGEDVFVAFRDQLARPLGMQDFRIFDTYYHLQPEKSRYPAYPFMLSTRDSARFGLLYLANGSWDGQQIVPRAWVEASRTAHSRNVRASRGYGLLWWVSEDPELAELGMYHAAGVGGQIIAVLPAKGLVIVQRVDTWLDDSVPYEATLELMKKVVAAKVRAADGGIVTAVPLEVPGPGSAAVDSPLREAISGTYTDSRGIPVMTVTVDSSNNLLAGFRFDDKGDVSGDVRKFNSGQIFRIVQRSGGGLEFENAQYPVRVAYSPDGTVSRMTIERPEGPVTLQQQEAAGNGR